MTAAVQTDGSRDVLGRVVEALERGLGDRLRSVVLFGSRARGDHHPDSDWDLLVIAEDLPERWMDRYQGMKRLLPEETRGSVSMLAKTPEEFEARVSELYLDIALDGRILYDRSHYVTERLAQLRRTMDEKGLYRLATAAGLTWHWRTQPTGRWSIEWER